MTFRSRKFCSTLFAAGALFVASAWLSAGYAQSGGVFSLGISDDAKIGFAWAPNSEPDVRGYKLYIGTVPGVYGFCVDVGLLTNFELPGLVRGMRYYFALTAYNSPGIESDFTPELVYDVPMLAEGSSESNGSEAGAITEPPAGEAHLNSPPIISAIPDQVLPKNRRSDPIVFTVGDLETPTSALQVIVQSSNPVILPDSGLSVAQSDDTVALFIEPSNGRTGVSLVTVAVTDGPSVTTTSFLVTVD